MFIFEGFSQIFKINKGTIKKTIMKLMSKNAFANTLIDITLHV